jgi:hypothetical protein
VATSPNIEGNAAELTDALVRERLDVAFLRAQDAPRRPWNSIG